MPSKTPPPGPPGSVDEYTIEDSVDADRSVEAPSPVFPEEEETGEVRYKPRRELGAGAMGEVLLVHDCAIGRDIAMKRLKKDTARARRRFSSEARLQGQLEHPAIAPVYDVGVTPDGTPYFTMKRIRGVSLRSVLESAREPGGKEAPFSRRRLLSAFSQICLAAHFAHERGVVHRDIKPENIMLGDYGEVYLIDWGIAKVVAQAAARDPDGDRAESEDGPGTREGDLVGTVAYMAPEQARGDHDAIDRRTDVYALGAILFEILTLKRLHESAPTSVMIRRILDGVEARPSARARHVDVPPELEAVCVAATRRDPEARLQNAREIHERIETYLDGDRDAELRRERAKKHALAAREAAAPVLDRARAHDALETQHRTGALREVGKALALDPTNRDALRTLISLLTTPPHIVPEEVRRAQEVTLLRQVRRGAILGGSVFLLAILYQAFLVDRIHDWRAWSIVVALWAGAILAGVVTAIRPTYPGLFGVLIFGVAGCVWDTPLTSPLISVIPIMVQCILFSMMNRWRRRIAVLAIGAAGVLLANFGDLIGLFPSTIRSVPEGMLLHSSAMDVAAVLAPARSLVVSLGLTTVCALIVGALRGAYAKADLEARLQSWQLGQLVPDEAARTMEAAD